MSKGIDTIILPLSITDVSSLYKAIDYYIDIYYQYPKEIFISKVLFEKLGIFNELRFIVRYVDEVKPNLQNVPYIFHSFIRNNEDIINIRIRTIDNPKISDGIILFNQPIDIKKLFNDCGLDYLEYERDFKISRNLTLNK